jgi:hypothetical protein
MTMQIIQHQELGSAQASITFNSIPQTYTDLLLVTSLRDTSTTNGWNNALIKPNGLATNLSNRVLYGWGNNNTGNFSDTYIYHETVGGGSTANVFSNSSVYITNYTLAVAKAISLETSTSNEATNAINALVGGMWNSSNAITSLVIEGQSGNLAQYSSATLYGITKGSNGVVVS